MKTAVLLINLGTPEGTEVSQVRKYLAEFLMDPYVVDIPWLSRWLLVHGLILRTRPAKSAEAYRKIWTERGSPLLFHTLDLAKKVARLLGPDFVVRASMRYGTPSIASALDELMREKPDRIVVFPLYPQYSLAATESSIQEFLAQKKKRGITIPHSVVGDFFGHEGYIGAFAETFRESTAGQEFDHVLFSFHGLPERQIRRLDESGEHCFSCAECCAEVCGKNRLCYRAQCFETARRIASKLALPPEKYSVSFQSRLGRTPWIRPFTDHVLDELPKKGVKRLAVFSPAFVADCLETLEEIAIRGRAQFLAAGGERLDLIPSLNSRDSWANAVAILSKSLGK